MPMTMKSVQRFPGTKELNNPSQVGSTWNEARCHYVLHKLLILLRAELRGSLGSIAIYINKVIMIIKALLTN